MVERKSLRAYEVQVLNEEKEGGEWETHWAGFATRGAAVKHLAAIDVPGTYRIGCFWPPVALAFAERKMVRTVEPVTKPGHGNRTVVVD